MSFGNYGSKPMKTSPTPRASGKKSFSSRTVIGVICIVLALLITFGVAPLVNRFTDQKVDIVRLKVNVPRGQILTADHLEIVNVGSYNLPHNVIKDRKAVIGKYAATDLYAGDYLFTSKLSTDNNLNGQWQFEIDRANSGVDRKLFDDSVSLKDSICVPFCPQSRLSGIQDTDFMSSVWYKRTIFLSDEQIEGCVKLHFGAVDYAASVYMNGVLCGTHKGGYISFVIDITDYVHSGENILCVHAEDDERSRLIPSGKQCHEYRSKGCHYTRTIGIWQTVWLELHPKTYIDKVSYQTDVDNGLLSISVQLVGKGVFCAEAFYEGKSCGKASVSSEGGATLCVLSLTEKHLWEVNKGGLYDLVLTYGDDHVKSYFGLRSIDYRDYKFYLNGRSVFQRLVLDQGFYPDGIYTATSDDDFVPRWEILCV